MPKESTSGTRVAPARIAEDGIGTGQAALTPAQREFAEVVGQALAHLWLKDGAAKMEDSGGTDTNKNDLAIEN